MNWSVWRWVWLGTQYVEYTTHDPLHSVLLWYKFVSFRFQELPFYEEVAKVQLILIWICIFVLCFYYAYLIQSHCIKIKGGSRVKSFIILRRFFGLLLRVTSSSSKTVMVVVCWWLASGWEFGSLGRGKNAWERRKKSTIHWRTPKHSPKHHSLRSQQTHTRIHRQPHTSLQRRNHSRTFACRRGFCFANAKIETKRAFRLLIIPTNGKLDFELTQSSYDYFTFYTHITDFFNFFFFIFIFVPSIGFRCSLAVRSTRYIMYECTYIQRANESKLNG